MTNTVQDIIARQQTLAASRRVWESHWQELGDYLLPRRADFTRSATAGEKRTDLQFDASPMQAARGLAASLDGLLKPKTQRWFGLRAADEALNEIHQVKLWLRQTEDRFFQAFYETSTTVLAKAIFFESCFRGSRSCRGSTA